eukprot:12413405-Karenia_brevis.AAC.1
MAAAGDRKEYDLLKSRKTNVIITTFGMASKTQNEKGTLELAIPCQKFDVVFEDEVQNENGENLFLIPCYLKPLI